MFANRLMMPFIILAFLFLYMAWEIDKSYSIWIIPFVLIVGLIYTFAPQVNWWWYQKHIPRIDPMVKMLLGKYSNIYPHLSEKEKQRFEHRVSLFEMANTFIPQGIETVPPDLKGIVCASAVELTFGREEFIFPKFETIVIYPHPFPSPQHEVLHIAEMEPSDGVVIFSMEHLMIGFTKPQSYYHIGLHEFAKIFIHTYPDEKYPKIKINFWKKIAKISGLKKDILEKWVGITIDDLPVAIVHYHTHQEKFKEVLPEMALSFDAIFKQIY